MSVEDEIRKEIKRQQQLFDLCVREKVEREVVIKEDQAHLAKINAEIEMREDLIESLFDALRSQKLSTARESATMIPKAAVERLIEDWQRQLDSMSREITILEESRLKNADYLPVLAARRHELGMCVIGAKNLLNIEDEL